MKNAASEKEIIKEIHTLIQSARVKLKNITKITPFIASAGLSDISKTKVFLKYENRQRTASFKERGAFFKLQSLSDEQRAKGVIAMSAGNHAQALAYHAQNLKIPCTIIMPKFTPNVKVRNTEKHGAKVISFGSSLEEAGDYAHQLSKQKQLTFIHPYDDKFVIAGQGTIALEMLDEETDLDTLLIPIGGGGLISGMAIAAKNRSPNIEIIGVETARYPSMQQALSGQTIHCGRTTLADGIGVKKPGKLPLKIIKSLVDDIILVSEQEIEQAVLMLLEKEKTLVEGAGAASLAALLAYPERFTGKTLGLLLSGGNIDMPVLSLIIQRGMEKTQRLISLTVVLRDTPGALSQITTLIEKTDANIVKIQHQRAFTKLPLEAVEVTLVLQTRGWDHIQEIQSVLKKAGVTYKSMDINSSTNPYF